MRISADVMRVTILTLVTGKVQRVHNVNGEQPGVVWCRHKSAAAALWDFLDAEYGKRLTSCCFREYKMPLLLL